MLATGTRSYANIVRGSNSTQSNDNLSQPSDRANIDTTESQTMHTSKTPCNVKDIGTDTPTDIALEIQQANIHTDKILVVGNPTKTEVMQKFDDAMQSLNDILTTITAIQTYPETMKDDFLKNFKLFNHSWETMLRHYIYT